MKNHTVTFETKTCGRCGGSGHYSYNQMHGTTCYGCSGRKVVYSKAGAAARIAFAAKRLDLCGAAVNTLQPGDRFLTEANKWATVVEVGEDGSRWLDNTTGEWVNYTHVTTKHGSRGFCRGTERVIVSRPELWPDLIAFARTLKGAIVHEPTVAVEQGVGL